MADFLLEVNFNYPVWIKYVHELQNWCYWMNEKRELDDSRVPMSQGDNVPHENLERLLQED